MHVCECVCVCVHAPIPLEVDRGETAARKRGEKGKKKKVINQIKNRWPAQCWVLKYSKPSLYLLKEYRGIPCMLTHQYGDRYLGSMKQDRRSGNRLPFAL